MADSWQQADAEAHEAKADAIDAALTALAAIHDAVSTPLQLTLDNVALALVHERDSHNARARLIASAR